MPILVSSILAELGVSAVSANVGSVLASCLSDIAELIAVLAIFLVGSSLPPLGGNTN